MHNYQRGDKVTIIGPSWNGNRACIDWTFSVRGMTADGMVAVRRKRGVTNDHWKYPVSSVKPYHEPAKHKRKKASAKKKLLNQINAMLGEIEPEVIQQKEPKLAAAIAALKRWKTKLKLAQTKIRVYSRKVKYYQKKAGVS